MATKKSEENLYTESEVKEMMEMSLYSLVKAHQVGVIDLMNLHDEDKHYDTYKDIYDIEFVRKGVNWIPHTIDVKPTPKPISDDYHIGDIKELKKM